MTQIKQNQIIPSQIEVFFPNFSLPRDLQNDGQRIWNTKEADSNFSSLPGEVVENSVPTSQQPVDPTTTPTPDAPLILSVKSQTVTFKPDGTATVDVVLTVQDIANVSEYDIRIAKSAGNL